MPTTSVLCISVRPSWNEFEKIGVCDLNHCETQDDHYCDNFEEGEEPETIEVIKRPKEWIKVQQGDSSSLTPLLVDDEPIRRKKKWDNMRAEQEAYEHLYPEEVE